MGLFKKRLTAIQTNFGSAHFPRTWSESALRPPSWPEGPRKGPFQPAPPPWPSVGRCLAQGSERLPGTAARARSPARPPRPPPALGVCCGCPARERAGASRTVPGGRPGGARFLRCGRLGSGHGTRKRGHGTRKPAQATPGRPCPPASARPRPPRAGPRRPQPPAAPSCPLQRAGRRPGRETGGPPASDRLSLGSQKQTRQLGCGLPPTPGLGGHLGARRPGSLRGPLVALSAYSPRCGGPGALRAGPRATVPESWGAGGKTRS